jgi:type IV pilus assembly protein PilW
MRNVNRQFGFSLVELMVGLTIGLLVLLSLSFILVNNTSARAELDKSAQQIENGRYAMDLMKRELRLAGYFGPFYTPFSAANFNPCASDVTSLLDALPLSVQGYALASSGANPLSVCIDNANLSATPNDILVVRRASTTETPVASATAGSTYLQTNGQTVSRSGSSVTGGIKLSVASDSATNTTTFNLTDKSGTAPLRQYAVQIYFVSPCDVMANGTTCAASDDGGRPIPTLKRISLPSASAKPVPESLVQGVERFHVEYGIDTSPTTGDGMPDSYVKAGGVASWDTIVTVKVYVLARSTKDSPGYQENKTYTLGSLGSFTPTDTGAAGGYKRHLFSETVRLLNVSARREI